MMKPFLKWAGGKKQLLEHILEFIKSFPIDRAVKSHFIEPFVGGGIVFLTQANPNTIINDLNSELINAYQVVRDNPVELMAMLDQMHLDFMADKLNYYSRIRNLDRIEGFLVLPKVTRAARMIFLNKTCFNGLYRVNADGYFNTPIGRNKIRFLYSKNNLNKISGFLNKLPSGNITNYSYEVAIENANYGDVIYIDPPYAYDGKNGFTKYQKDGFNSQDLINLKKICDSAIERGSFVILSNNDTNDVRRIFNSQYSTNYYFYDLHKFNTKRTINSKASFRANGKELIILGYPKIIYSKVNLNLFLRLIALKKITSLNDLSTLSKRFRVSRKTIASQIRNLIFFDLVTNDFKLNNNGLNIRNSPKLLRFYTLKEHIRNHNFLSSFINFIKPTDDTEKIKEIIVQFIKSKYRFIRFNEVNFLAKVLLNLYYDLL